MSDLKKENITETHLQTVCLSAEAWLSSTYFHADASTRTERLFRACGSGTRQITCQSWYQHISSHRLGQWNLFMPWRCIHCFIVVINDAPLSNVLYLNHFWSPRIIWCLSTCWGPVDETGTLAREISWRLKQGQSKTPSSLLHRHEMSLYFIWPGFRLIAWWILMVPFMAAIAGTSVLDSTSLSGT